MILSSELAQQIVNKIMPIVHHNVNIMNDEGIIIGSGDNKRLDSFHQGAEEVIRSGKVVEIYPEDLTLYPGALPGLNWPIIVNTQIVGVVGVSGDPDTVRSTAELVKIVAELILEREIFMEEFRSQSHFHEGFIMLLLSEQAEANYSQITAQAAVLRFDLNLPRLIAVANVEPILENAFTNYGSYDLVSTRTRESLTQLLETSNFIDEKDMIAFLENQLISIKHFPLETPVQVINDWGHSFLQLIKSAYPETNLSLGIGSLTESPLAMRSSYNEAQFELKEHQRDNDISSIYDFDNLATYLVREPQATSSCAAFKVLQDKLTNKTYVKYDMRNTILSLLKNNLNLSATAKDLFIHRNTLVFRLNKLKQLTGLSPAQYINHAILCKFLYANDNLPYKKVNNSVKEASVLNLLNGNSQISGKART
ncbi:Carbohydrate diacid regulator [Sporomusa ovata DSM 2662]|uniref:Sugar diacid utilization regulator SdaR n=1 Tax=Sporomusa ovata TaxID=2378 RepID=A0A0U1L3U0_9FIRM|nr:sugar diacid recognition domain-containing protein [Sporomusa ovata]EQB25213.1 sugar diacid utilization regulator [Sporomusa ovata DSM 2662]CQR73773.1 Sugar diacid utilization regulator SdaR [Sporomusa ovata]